MRRSIDLLVKRLSEQYDFMGPVYEFGAFQAPGQEGRSHIRDYFKKLDYVGCDLQKGPGVDRILDLHSIDLPDNSVGTVILSDVLEHVEFCQKALDELLRILKPDGMMILVSVMYFPIHNHPADYWRFTPEAFKSLLSKFESSIVDYSGLHDFPTSVIAIAKNGALKDADKQKLENIISNWKKTPQNIIEILITAILPPFILVWLYKMLRAWESRRKIDRS